MSLPSARQKPEESGASKAGGGGAVVSGAVPTAREIDPMIGRVLDGRFTIESRLGAGSMGTVYRAKQHAMGRDVAIKILRSDRALDEGARARFLREARANSLLASPHTVTVFDFGQADDGDFFLAMELLEGESLGERLKRDKRLGPEAAVEVVRQALRSLAEAHAKGIIHRDLKPDNLFFAKVLTTDESGARRHDETVKVVDFGIAKMLGTDNAPMNAIETQAGTVFGTPRYMSPEQAQGKPLDARSDLYSLGRHPLPHAHRAPAVHRRRRHRRHGAAHQDGAQAPDRGGPSRRHSARARERRHARAGQGAVPAPGERRGVEPGAGAGDEPVGRCHERDPRSRDVLRTAPGHRFRTRAGFPPLRRSRRSFSRTSHLRRCQTGRSARSLR